MTDTPAFFHRDGDFFVGNDPARGPWSEHACHAGPVTALIARAIEDTLPEKQLARLSSNYIRPVPMNGIRIEVEVSSDRRIAAYASATLFDRDDQVCARSEGLLLATMELDSVPTAELARPRFEEATIGDFPVGEALHALPFFGNSVEMAYPPGEDTEHGPTTAWMRTPPIIEGEAPSPFQTICPLADCANGLARNDDFSRLTCVNPDLVITIHRLPVSDWLASEAVSFWEPNGIGSTQATLFDTEGVIGSALQTLVLRPVA